MNNADRATTTAGARKYANKYGGNRYKLSKLGARRRHRRWCKRDTDSRLTNEPTPRQPQPCNPRY